MSCLKCLCCFPIAKNRPDCIVCIGQVWCPEWCQKSARIPERLYDFVCSFVKIGVHSLPTYFSVTENGLIERQQNCNWCAKREHWKFLVVHCHPNAILSLPRLNVLVEGFLIRIVGFHLSMVLSELTKRNHDSEAAAHLVAMQNSGLVQGGRGCFDLPKQGDEVFSWLRWLQWKGRKDIWYDYDFKIFWADSKSQSIVNSCNSYSWRKQLDILTMNFQNCLASRLPPIGTVRLQVCVSPP